MDKEQEDLHNQRKNYIKFKRNKRTLQMNLKDLRSTLGKDKKFLMESLKTKRLEMLGDKDKRDAEGISNQKSWESEIKKQTLNEEISIEDSLKEKEESIKKMELDLEILSIDVEDLKLELMINLAYVNEKTRMVI